MRKYDIIRERAVRMRKEEHMSYNDLQKHFHLSKGTLHYWFRDLVVPKNTGLKGKELGRYRGSQRTSLKFRAIREDSYQIGLQESRSVLLNKFYRDFIILYLGEGTKRGSCEVCITNSNSSVILISKKVLMKLAPSIEIHYSLHLHIDDSVERAISYWANELNIEKTLIRIQVDKPKAMARCRHRLEHGTMHMRVFNTHLKQKIIAWMDAIQQEWKNSDVGDDGHQLA